MRRPQCLKISPAILVGALAWLLTAPAFAQPDTPQVNDNGLTCFNGYGYTLKGGDYRYTEHHEVKRVHGHITTWNVTYIGTHGQVLARKHMDFSANPTVPVYRMTMPNSGYEEGIRHDDGRWTMFKRESANARVQTKSFTIDDPMAADSGFNPLVQQHFDELNGGQTIAFKFVAAGRQSVIDLKAYKTGDTTFEGKPAVNFKAELDMFLISHFVPSLKLTYDPKTERLLEYRGIGNMHNDQGKVYPVRVSYYSHMPAVAKAHDAPAAACGSVADRS
ncbi:hypothetical protein [Salinisphaera hydrothermalis]|uniref:DUF3108 domain-containing protein n=1 Tax=Salinisphaera hydrothermalis (strain C41B8) TaxID=1304275 RepID=A0A084ILN0_SALHC|nr:hypothetical protein [Salinisphaera hydrothermalis]KEZ77614.1 hypothetical protein C41B8_08515 [Salinisphaera hydrothermalis C41B8]